MILGKLFLLLHPSVSVSSMERLSLTHGVTGMFNTVVGFKKHQGRGRLLNVRLHLRGSRQELGSFNTPEEGRAILCTATTAVGSYFFSLSLSLIS